MRFSPMSLFCEECGAANAEQASHCFACHATLQPPGSSLAQPLDRASTSTTSSPMASSAATRTTSTGSTKLLNGRYDIIREVGQGGFGVVYESWDTRKRKKHETVAIKQINLSTLSTREIIDATDSYNREVGILSQLKHKSLPTIYDHFTDPDHWYLVMDYIQGETLEDYMKQAPQGRLSMQEVLSIGIELCDVLLYLHSQRPPIIFRDIKPANIMRKANGQLYLIDFGIARHFTPGQSKDTGPLGSPGYAAPEQYGRAQTTIQTDIYGLGATLQALLTGDDPSSTTTTANSTIQSPLPKKLTQLLDQMLETDVRKRPKNMEEVRNRLQDSKDGWKKKLASFTWGLLIGSMPYSLLLPLLMLNGPGFNSIIVSLYFVLLCTWPIALLGQVISAISFVFVPRKRFLGLGILAMLIFLMLGFMYGFLPLPFSGPS